MVEASVDELSSKVTAHKVWVAVDVGRALNPLAVEGQAQGGVWMGMGQALSEATEYDAGRMLHGNLLDYRVPTMAESPDIEVHHRRERRSNGPSAPRKPSEGMLAGFLPALREAVQEAAGVAATASRSARIASPSCSTRNKPPAAKAARSAEEVR